MSAAQDQQTEAETRSAGSSTETKAPEGFQKRIDELTAKIYERDGQIQALMDQNQAMMAITTERVASRVPQEEVPLPDVDPDIVRFLDAKLTKHLAPLMKGYNDLASQIASQRFEAQATGASQEVVKTANQLIADWRRRGLSGWNPEDALTMAEGIVAKKSRQGRKAQGDFNGMSDTVVTNGAGAAPPPGQAPTRQPGQALQKPKDFERWNPGKQAEWLENALGDTPF